MPFPKQFIKVYKSEIKSFNDADLILTHFISTEQEDRSKDIVRADGIHFDGTPVVLKQHGQDPVQGMEPIAKSLGIAVGTNNIGVKGVIATTQYYDGSRLTPPDNTGRKLYEKAKGGYMPYWSIGFRIEDGVPRPGGGVEIRKALVYEYSQVAVPDNIGAAVIKSFEDGETSIEKFSNEFFTFGVAPAPALAPVLLVPAIAPTPMPLPPQPSPIIFKSISERIALDLPMRSMYIIWDGFISEIFNTTKEKVADILLELSSILEPYALQAVKYLNPKAESEKAVMLKSLLIEKKDFTAERAPLESIIKQPVVAEDIPTIPKPNMGILTFKFSPEEIVTKVPSINVDPMALSKLIKDSIRENLMDAVKKLRGKLD